MSVVGLTFGSGAKAIRPSAASAASVATSAITRAVGMRALVPVKPAVSAIASSSERGGGPAHVATSTDRRRQRGALLGQQRAAGAAQHARGLGREVPAAGQHLGGRRVGHRPAVAEQDRAIGPRRRELGVVGGDEHRGTARRQLAQPRREPRAVRPVHAARRLVEADGHRRLAGREHQLEREPLALAAGDVARMAVGERAGPRHVVADAVVQEVVAGVLQQQRHAARARDLPARRLDQPGEQPQQGRLAGPVAAHQRDGLPRAPARGRARAGSPARGRSRTTHAAPRRHKGGQTPLAPAEAIRLCAVDHHRASTPRGVRPPLVVEERSQGAAGGLDRGGAVGDAGERAQAGDRRLELGRRPGGERLGRAVEGDGAVPQRDDAVGGGQAALEPVLGQQHGRPPLLVDPAAGRRAARRPRPGRAARSARRAAAAAGGRRARRRARPAGARRPTARASSGRAAARCRARAPPPPPRARPRRRSSRGSRAGTRAPSARCPSRPASRGPGTASRRRLRARPGRGGGCRARRRRGGRRRCRRGSAGRARTRRAGGSTCRSPSRRPARRTRRARRSGSRRAATAPPRPHTRR